MKLLFTLVIGIGIGAVVVWFYGTNRGRETVHAAGDQIATTTKSARDTVEDKLKVLDLHKDDIKDQLARTGKVVWKKAGEAGQAIADVTADARVTTAIKAKLVASRDLSALNISVNTTSGIVTMSGTVQTEDDIAKAMLLAMGTDGVHQVISTLQVKPRAGKS
jgi:hyperosmotically inducible protein